MSTPTANVIAASGPGEASSVNEEALATPDSPPVLLKDIEFDFLELIYETIRSIEKETSNEPMTKMLPGGAPSMTECHYKMASLGEKYAECREQLERVAGIDTCKAEQLEQLRALREQLVMRKQLLMKYKQINLATNNKIVQIVNKF